MGDYALKNISEGLWHAESQIRMPGRVQLPIRMTILRLGNGGFLLHSPIQPRPETVSSLEALGKPTILLAPNGFHHLYLESWHQRFPEAKIWAPLPVQRKHPNMKFDLILTDKSENVLAPDIRLFRIGGMPKIEEFVLYYRPARTLIVTDLLFNLQNPSFGLGLILRVMGTYKRANGSRLFRLFIDNRAAYHESLERLRGLDVERVVMAHGEIIEGPRCREVMDQVMLVGG